MDKTSEFNKNDIAENKVISCFAYMGLLFVMPLWGASDSPFARFHANQGMVLFINEMVLSIMVFVSHILVMCNVLPDAMRVVRTVLLLILYLMMFIFVIFGMVNALRGKAKELPLIGSIRIII